MTRWTALLLAGISLLGAAPAFAHKPSDAYLELAVGERGEVRQRLDVAVRDLDRDLVLDADADGRITWGEVKARWDEVTRVTAAAVAPQAAGQDCTAGPAAPPRIADHLDGAHLVIERRWSCPAGAAGLDLRYALFAATDPTHRGLLRLAGDAGQGGEVRVLVPGSATVPLAAGVAPGPGSFFLDGLHHIAIGLDHVLFLVTLLTVAVWRRDGRAWVPRDGAASAWREALKLVTAFTLAHSLTLGLAAAGLLSPPSRWVESLIAFSVLLAAVDNLRPFLPGQRWAVVGAFGLVHGIGFAGPLQDLGLRGGELIVPLLAFNLGVEAGQVLIVLLVLPWVIRWRAAPSYARWWVKPVSAGVAALAALWTFERVTAIPVLAALG
jgi:hypothetical protein